MKHGRLAIVFLIVVSVVFVASAQTKQKQSNSKVEAAHKAGDTQPDRDREMQMATPAAAHSRLGKLAGEYTTTTKFYMQPGAAPQETAGEAKLWMTLDGRFLSEENTGTFMGQPLKGFRMLGYNNASKRYEGIWTYSMSTAIMSLNGTSSDGGKTVTLAAAFEGESGAKEKLSVTLRQADDDHFVVGLSGTSADGKPGPMLETTYTRKK